MQAGQIRAETVIIEDEAGRVHLYDQGRGDTLSNRTLSGQGRRSAKSILAPESSFSYSVKGELKSCITAHSYPGFGPN